MKSSFTLSSLLLLLLFSVESASTSAMFWGHRAVRIPEHTCQKTVEMAKCDLQNCGRECSKEAYGFGVCEDGVCSCTYFCKNPPV